MQRGSCTAVEHRARVWHAAARALVAHHAACRAAPHSAHRATTEHATPMLHGSSPPIPTPRVPVVCASFPAVPAQSASGPPVPVLGTQQVLLALPLQQQLVLVRTGWLILHAQRGRCACWMLHTCGLHARRLHLPRGAPSVHSQWDWARSRRCVLASSSRQPHSMPPIVPHMPAIPHDLQWSRCMEEGARRPWAAPSRR